MAKGKKSGAFLNQKKKAGSADFSNPKAKVGRKVKRRVGETDASFQTRQLSIGEQSIARQKKDGAKTSKRGLTCEEHLGQLGHHNDKARGAAAEGLADICAAHADEAWRLFGPLLDGAARLLGDAHRPCRRRAAPAPGGPRASDRAARRTTPRWTTPRRRRGARRGRSSFLVDHGDGDLRRAVAANLLGPLLTPLANAARVAPRPGTTRRASPRTGQRCSSVVAALFLADAPARKRGRRFSFAPEDDVLDVDDVAEGDDAIPGHRGVVLLQGVRRAAGDWRRGGGGDAAVADGEPPRASRTPRARGGARGPRRRARRGRASPSSWPAAGALLYHLPLPLGDDVVAAAAAAARRQRRRAPRQLTAQRARDEDGGAGACLARAPRLLERSAAALRDGDAAATRSSPAGGGVAERRAPRRRAGDDGRRRAGAAGRRRRGRAAVAAARVEYLCVSLCQRCEASPTTAFGAGRRARPAAPRGGGRSRARASGPRRRRPQACSGPARVSRGPLLTSAPPSPGAVSDATPLPKSRPTTKCPSSSSAPPRRRRSSTMEAAPDGDAQKRVAPFLTKLSNLVESCPPEVGGWTPDGLSFLVNDEAITHQVLPNFFSHTNFRSFCRQLSCCARPHGFRKTRRRKLSAANGQCGWSEFSHAFFVRNRRDLLCQIKRMEHLSTSSSNGEPAEEQPTKRPRLPSVDDEHAARSRSARWPRRRAARPSVGPSAAPRASRRRPRALTAAIASVPSPAGKATPSGLGRNSHNARPSFGDDTRKSLPADVTIRPAAVPVTVNPPDTPADRRFSADIGRAWPATAPWSPDAVVHKPAAPPAAHFLAARVVSQASPRAARRPSSAGARAAKCSRARRGAYVPIAPRCVAEPAARVAAV
ncbi:hypothetical protein JL721_6499 [Aureococcus anophagefferens]|nr:hypothetical protein JL721_6499 [Aureococcus anophagefferens]